LALVASSQKLVYIIDRYHLDIAMTATAKLFKSGRSQAVRLPKEFRFDGKEVRIRRHGRGVLLEPVGIDLDEMFAKIDALGAKFPEREEQPPNPERDSFD
jgi:antitoxin VapB